jgi:glycerol-3-phosphate acyltransferase PlsX
MKIIVDAFGGDNAPLEALKGCEMAVSEYGYKILLCGDENKIKNVCKENNISLDNMEIEDTKEVITMDDSPGEILKSKKNSSMGIGLKLLADNKGDAFISAGNSGALVMGATFIAKRIKGVKRPAFSPVMPKDKGVFMLLDSGANLECRSDVLSQFGIMGSIYMKKVIGVTNPRVGLLNVGTEEHKGTDNLQEAFKLLTNEKTINFIGNVEAREVPADAADVVVTDGFTGNIALKLYEGVAGTLLKKIKNVFLSNLKTKIAALLVMKQIKKLKKDVDYREYGGAPVLGIKHPVYKSHGSADAVMFKNGINFAAKYAKSKVIDEIEKVVLNKT